MSGLEVVGSVSALIDLAKAGWQVVEFCKEVKGAPKTLPKLLAQVNDLSNELEWLNKTINALDSSDPARAQLETLFVRNQKTGELRYGSLLVSIQEEFRDLQKSLRIPSTDKSQKLGARLMARAKVGLVYVKWGFSQTDVEKRLAKLGLLRNEINSCIVRAGFDVEQDLRHGIGSLKTAQEHIQAGQIKLQQEVQAISVSQSVLTQVGTKIEANTETALERQQVQTTIALSQSEDLTIIKSEVHELVTFRHADEFQQLLKWVHPWKSFHPVLDRLDRTLMPADWLFEEKAYADVFNAWYEGSSWDIQLWGRAGYGKTMLCTSLSSLLSDRLSDTALTPVLTLYIKTEDQATQSSQQLLLSLLKQLLAHGGPDSVPSKLKELQSTHSADVHLPTDQAFELLEEVLSKQARTYILVDGLDESEETVWKTLQHDLRRLKAQCNLSILYTLRPLAVDQEPLRYSCDVCGADPLTLYYTSKSRTGSTPLYVVCTACAKSPNKCPSATDDLFEPYANDTINISLIVPNTVIERFVTQLVSLEMSIGVDTSEQAVLDREAGWVRSTINRTRLGLLLEDKVARELNLGKSIVSGIVGSAGGCFLLARMQWRDVQTSQSIKDIRRALRELPKEFNKVYAGAMDRISKQSVRDAQLGKSVIKWLTFSERVLGLKELQHALAVDTKNFMDQLDGAEDIADIDVFDPTALVQENVIATTTMGLITVSHDKSIRLMHRSAYEYFAQQDVRDELFGEDAGVEIALNCIGYLAHTRAKTPCLGENDDRQIAAKLEELPFAAYASQHWGTHAAKYQNHQTIQKAVRLIATQPEVIDSAVQISQYWEQLDPTGWDVRKGASPIHVLSWFGLHFMLDELVSTPEMVECSSEFGYGRTPLIYACRGGSRETIANLLQLGASTQARDGFGVSPLGHAIARKNDTAVKQLCESSHVCLSDSVDSDGRNALMAAVRSKHLPSVKLILDDEDIDVNQKGPHGFTALIYAASSDALEILTKVLDHSKINVNQSDSLGCTALHHAAAGNRPLNVRELLSRGADIGAGSGAGGTALVFAMDRRFTGVVHEFFSQFEKQPFSHESTRDGRGEGLLHCAVRVGSADVVDWLLQHGFCVNVQDVDGISPLQIASQLNSTDIVQKLLDHGADMTLRNTRGETAADVARLNGHTDLATKLEISVDGEKQKAGDKALPTWIMAGRGLIEELKSELIADPSKALAEDFDGDTALHVAIRKKDFACISMILEQTRGIDVASKQNRFGRTPLHEACLVDANLTVELLLKHDPLPDLNVRNTIEETALNIATTRFNELSMMTLVNAGAELDPPEKLPGHLFEAAIKADNIKAVQRLIDARMEVKTQYRTLARKSNASVEMQRLLDTHRTNRLPPRAEAKISETTTVLENVKTVGSPVAITSSSSEATVVEVTENATSVQKEVKTAITVLTSEITASAPSHARTTAVADKPLSPTLPTLFANLPSVPSNDLSIQTEGIMSLPAVPSTVPEPLPSLSPLRVALEELQSPVEQKERALEPALLA